MYPTEPLVSTNAIPYLTSEQKQAFMNLSQSMRSPAKMDNNHSKSSLNELKQKAMKPVQRC